MSLSVTEFVDKWRRLNPRFTGSVEFHFFDGQLKDIKSHQSHKAEIEQKQQGK